MTAEREADAPPDRASTADAEEGGAVVHRAELAALESDKAGQVRYAWRALGGPGVAVSGKELLAFIETHGGTARKSIVYAELKAIRAQHGQPDTGTLTKLSPDVIAHMDAARARKAAAAGRAAPVPAAPEAAVPVAPEPAPVRVESVEPVGSRVPVERPERVEPVEFQPPRRNGSGGIPVADSGESGVPAEPLESAVESDSGAAGIPADQGTGGPESVAELDEEAGAAVTVPVEFQFEPEAGPVVPEAVPAVPVERPERLESAVESVPGAPERGLSPWVTGGCYAVALATLPVSLNTSWRFFEHVMGITSRPELFGMAAVMELALVMCGIGMATSVKRFGDPGAFRLVVWGICLFSGWTAWHMSGTVGEALARMVLGPVLGAIMLHLALGLIRRTHHHRTGTVARVARELRERLLSRLGLADDQRDAAQRTRDRAATRAVKLSMAGKDSARHLGKLQKALLAAGVADDPRMRDRLLARRQVAHGAREFAALEQGSPWAD